MLTLPLTVSIVASKRLRFYLVGIHICGVAALFLAALNRGSQVAGWAVLSLSLLYYWHSLSLPDQGIRLRGDAEGNLSIWQGNTWLTAHLSGASVILPSCTVLSLAIENRRSKLDLLILPDSLPAHEFRQLRVWLRWRGSKASTARRGSLLIRKKLED